MGLVEKNKLLKKEAILTAAKFLIQSGGAENLTMRALAKEASVGHVTPYSLFGSKDQILIALLNEPLKDLFKIFVEAQGKTGSPVDIMFSLVEKGKSLYVPEEDYYRSLFRALVSSEDGTGRKNLIRLARVAVAPMVQMAINDEGLRADTNVETLANQLVMTPLGYLMMWSTSDITTDEYLYQVLYTFTISLMQFSTEGLKPILLDKIKELDEEFIRLNAVRDQLNEKEQQAD